MKPETYLITFFTDVKKHGYAVVNAPNPKVAETILQKQGRERENRYHITGIEKLFAPCQGYSIVNEGIISGTLDAYKYAVDVLGFKGTIADWLKSLVGPKGNPGKQGDKGEDGHTPQRGIDYFTPQDIEEVTEEIKDAIIASISKSDTIFRGVINSATDISSLTDYKAGNHWVVQTADTYVGQPCESGDLIYCIRDFDNSYKDSDFTVIQNNIEEATEQDILDIFE